MTKELYRIILDQSIRTSYSIFKLFTNTIYLGHNDIHGWNLFYDLLYTRLNESDIRVVVEIRGDFHLIPEELEIFRSISSSLQGDFPDKIIFAYVD